MAGEAKRTLSDILDTLPVRGTPGGYRDIWDDPCPAIVARVLAEQERAQQNALLALVRLGVAEDATDGPYGSPADDLDLDPTDPLGVP